MAVKHIVCFIMGALMPVVAIADPSQKVATGANQETSTVDDVVPISGEGLRPQIMVISEGARDFAGMGIKSEDKWLGLYCAARGCELRDTKLTVEQVIVRGYDSKHAGQRISVSDSVKPLAIFRGQKNLKPGSVSTIYHLGQGEPPKRQPPHDLEIPLKSQFGQVLEIVPKRLDGAIEYKLQDGKKSQHLATLSQDEIAGAGSLPLGKWLVMWAGDMDGDKKTDLLLRLIGRVEEHVGATLYLSSEAKGEEIVGKALEYHYWPVDNPGC